MQDRGKHTGSTQYDRSPAFSSEMPMTAHSASAGPVTPVRVRTGGPKGDGDGSALLEHVLGWLLVVVCAMRAAQGLSWRRLLRPRD